jgi:hypothetical protein
MTYENPPPAGIRVITKFFPLAFLLFFCTPRIHLDGGPPVPRKWGETDIPVYPGRHQVRCYFRYLFYRAVGDNSIVVDVAPGQLVTVQWKAPWLVFLKGKWSVLGVQPLGAPAVAPAVGPFVDPSGYVPTTAQPGYAAAEPVAAQPVAVQPMPEPVAAQPVAAQPVAAQPVAVQPMPEPVAAQPVAQAAQQPAAWHPDPTGRHQLRYWDGSIWTPHVADNGVSASDPLQ